MYEMDQRFNHDYQQTNRNSSQYCYLNYEQNHRQNVDEVERNAEQNVG
jgi:hypothetical protein